MKLIFLPMFRTGFRAVALAFCIQGTIASAHAGQEVSENKFPFVINPELGAAEFAPGDGLVITSIRGSREHLEPGGRYVVEGSYTLVSAESADLAWFATLRGPTGGVPIADDEHVNISKGSGGFRLKKTLLDDGWLHVSFHVTGRSHGGLYFGEKGRENTILRKKSWSDFWDDRHTDTADRAADAAESNGLSPSSSSNLAILTFLGKPVPAPADLDTKYAPASLLAAFTTSISQAGMRLQKLESDSSEFPYLLYGLVDGKHSFREFEKILQGIAGYAYSGSVVGSTDDGSTYFALNMVPRDQYPSGQADACNRRLMIRLQMLADAARQLDIRAGADNPAPVSPTEKLYVTINYTDPIQFERMRYSSLTQEELLLNTLKNTAKTQAQAAGYAGEVIVLDEETKAPEGATVLTLTWGTSSAVTVDLVQGGQKKYLGVVKGSPLAFHPDHDRMQRRLDRALMPDAHRDESLRVGTELELFYALQYVVKYQQSQKRA